MVRIISLATLAVIGILMAWLPSVQSFNFGRISVHSPIVLRAPSAGPLEARQRPAPPVAATTRAREMVSSMLKRLTTGLQDERTTSGATPGAPSPGDVPAVAASPKSGGLRFPSLGRRSAAAVDTDLSWPGPLAAGPAAPPPPDTTEQAAEQPAEEPGPAAAAAPAPQVNPSPADPARPGHAAPPPGGARGGSGKGGRGSGHKVHGGDDVGGGD